MPTCGCSVVPGVQGCREQLGIPALASPLPQFPTPFDEGTQTLPPHGDRGRADASTSLKRSEMESTKVQSRDTQLCAPGGTPWPVAAGEGWKRTVWAQG